MVAESHEASIEIEALQAAIDSWSELDIILRHSRRPDGNKLPRAPISCELYQVHFRPDADECVIQVRIPRAALHMYCIPG